MVEEEYVPDRGDILWLNFTPQLRHEQGGRRPAFVISPREFNEPSRLAIFCPITSNVKGHPFEVALPTSQSINGAVLVDHIKSLDWNARGVQFAMKSRPTTLAEVLGKLSALILPSSSIRGADG